MSDTDQVASRARASRARARGHHTFRRRRGMIAALALSGVLLAVLAASQRPGAPAAVPSSAGQGDQPAVKAYLVATGIFSAPESWEGHAYFNSQQGKADSAESAVAFAAFGDQVTFETLAWRDLIQRGRTPLNRPPAIDFQREVAVLIWTVREQTPPSVRAAPGLVLRGAAVQHQGVELRIGPSNETVMLPTPAATGTVTPYALVTILRNQWAIPVPAPDLPAVVVTLVK